MKINRLLNAAQIFNTLIPLMLVTLLIALVGWGQLEEVFKKPITVNTVVVPGASLESSKVTFSLAPSSIKDNGDVIFLKLVARNERRIYEERWSGEVRNLLLVKSKPEEAVWLFPDQSLELVSIKELFGFSILDKNLPTGEVVADKDAPYKGLSIQTRFAVKGKDQDKLSLYLVRHNGTGLAKVLEDVDEILSEKTDYDTLRVIYQKGDAVKAARISIINFKIVSDIKLAQVTQLR